MPEVTLQQLGAVSPAIGAAGKSFWTPDNIGQIISGIKELMIEYNKLKGTLSPDSNADAGIGRTPSDMIPQSKGVTMQQLTAFGKQLCDMLASQGYGDKRIIEVLQATPFTINQIRGMIP